MYKINIDPIGKGRPRFSRIGMRVYTDDKTKRNQHQLQRLLRDTYQEAIILGPISLCVVFNVARPRTVKRASPSVKPDLDNMIKQFCDSANGILYKDDAQICHIDARKQYDCTGSIEFTVKPL